MEKLMEIASSSLDISMREDNPSDDADVGLGDNFVSSSDHGQSKNRVRNRKQQTPEKFQYESKKSRERARRLRSHKKLCFEEPENAFSFNNNFGVSSNKEMIKEISTNDDNICDKDICDSNSVHIPSDNVSDVKNNLLTLLKLNKGENNEASATLDELRLLRKRKLATDRQRRFRERKRLFESQLTRRSTDESLASEAAKEKEREDLNLQTEISSSNINSHVDHSLDSNKKSNNSEDEEDRSSESSARSIEDSKPFYFPFAYPPFSYPNLINPLIAGFIGPVPVLPLVSPPPPGHQNQISPPEKKPLTNAERQRRYRERLKAKKALELGGLGLVGLDPFGIMSHSFYSGLASPIQTSEGELGDDSFNRESHDEDLCNSTTDVAVMPKTDNCSQFSSEELSSSGDILAKIPAETSVTIKMKNSRGETGFSTDQNRRASGIVPDISISPRYLPSTSNEERSPFREPVRVELDIFAKRGRKNLSVEEREMAKERAREKSRERQRRFREKRRVLESRNGEDVQAPPDSSATSANPLKLALPCEPSAAMTDKEKLQLIFQQLCKNPEVKKALTNPDVVNAFSNPNIVQAFMMNLSKNHEIPS